MLKFWQATGRAVLGIFIGLVALAALACADASPPTPEPPPKDPIVFSDLSWDSAKLQNRMAMFIVDRGYGYPVGIISGDTIALFDQLLMGNTQVNMEI